LIPVPECPTTRDTRERSPTPSKHNLVLSIEKVACPLAKPEEDGYQNNQDRL
jgi:hypothetical protein